jgi:hypothetical protein
MPSAVETFTDVAHDAILLSTSGGRPPMGLRREYWGELQRPLDAPDFIAAGSVGRDSFERLQQSTIPRTWMA